MTRPLLLGGRLSSDRGRSVRRSRRVPHAVEHVVDRLELLPDKMGTDLALAGESQRFGQIHPRARRPRLVIQARARRSAPDRRPSSPFASGPAPSAADGRRDRSGRRRSSAPAAPLESPQQYRAGAARTASRRRPASPATARDALTRRNGPARHRPSSALIVRRRRPVTGRGAGRLACPFRSTRARWQSWLGRQEFATLMAYWFSQA